jgi:hypothetical protein
VVEQRRVDASITNAGASFEKVKEHVAENGKQWLTLRIGRTRGIIRPDSRRQQQKVT